MDNMILAALLFLVVGILLLGRRPAERKSVPVHVERALTEEVEADDVDPAVFEGRLVERVGVALRIAREVKMRFGGTPNLSEANRLLCARYVADACVDHGITRKVDQWRILCKARPIVFLPLEEEVLEAQFNASGVAEDMRESIRGWAPNAGWGLFRRVVNGLADWTLRAAGAVGGGVGP